LVVLGLILVSVGFGDDGDECCAIDHYVKVRSTASEISGQATEIYVREVVEQEPA